MENEVSPEPYRVLKIAADELAPELVTLRRYLHAHPEVSWSEHATADKIVQILRNEGMTVTRGLAGTGFYTDIQGAQPGPHIAWRADMDALSIEDRKTAPYASTHSGVGHMCGHDAHTTIALGIAKLLHQHRAHFRGTIRVFWQPAEETTPSGAPKMIEDGVLEGISAVFGMHVDPTLASGKIAIKPGPDTASYDAFEIVVQAPSSVHSARPHVGKDTIWIATQLVTQLYQLATRIIDSRSPLVISVGKFQAGDALNVLPESAVFGGTIRASDETSRKAIKNHLVEMCRTAEKLHGVKIKVKLPGGSPPVQNNPELTSRVLAIMETVLPSSAIETRQQSMGAEDFGFYSQKIPAVFIRVGTSCSPETSHALHSNLFDIDESTLAPTVALQAWLLTQHTHKHANSLQ
jgi:amidohydrolase